ASILYSPWLGAVAALVTVAALAYGIGGKSLLRRILPAWVFLWLLIPPPFGLDGRLISMLQTLTSRFAGRVLDTFGVFHVMAGNVVEVGEQRLLVEEACSGIHSFLTVLVVTVFFVLWARRPLLPAALLVVAAVGWALVGNVARVVGVTVFSTQWGFNVTTGW